jgi:hypothetical protein
MRPYAIYINEAALASAPSSGLQREKLMRFSGRWPKTFAGKVIFQKRIKREELFK